MDNVKEDLAAQGMNIRHAVDNSRNIRTGVQITFWSRGLFKKREAISSFSGGAYAIFSPSWQILGGAIAPVAPRDLHPCIRTWRSFLEASSSATAWRRGNWKLGSRTRFLNRSRRMKLRSSLRGSVNSWASWASVLGLQCQGAVLSYKRALYWRKSR